MVKTVGLIGVALFKVLPWGGLCTGFVLSSFTESIMGPVVWSDVELANW